LWHGLAADPRWLRNRGVWVLAGRALLRRESADKRGHNEGPAG
jgi:hypothetical protein